MSFSFNVGYPIELLHNDLEDSL